MTTSLINLRISYSRPTTCRSLQLKKTVELRLRAITGLEIDTQASVLHVGGLTSILPRSHDRAVSAEDGAP